MRCCSLLVCQDVGCSPLFCVCSFGVPHCTWTFPEQISGSRGRNRNEDTEVWSALCTTSAFRAAVVTGLDEAKECNNVAIISRVQASVQTLQLRPRPQPASRSPETIREEVNAPASLPEHDGGARAKADVEQWSCLAVKRNRRAWLGEH